LGRPDVLAALSEYAAPSPALQLEIARQYPGRASQPGLSVDQGDNKWSLGLSFDLPVLNQNQGLDCRGRRRAAPKPPRASNALQARVLGRD